MVNLILLIGLLFSTVTIDRPVFDGATIVTGNAAPGTAVTLRVIQNPALTQTVQADSEGVYRFALEAPLNAGYIIQVRSGDSVDYAIVEQAAARVYLPFVGTP